MKKNYNSKKKTTIVTLSLVTVCLVVGLFYFVGSMDEQLPALPAASKPPVEIEVVVPNAKLPKEQSVQDGNNDTPETSNTPKEELPTAKPARTPTKEEATPPTEKPKTDDGKDRTPPPAESGKDHEFTPEAPNKKPEYKPEQSQPDSKPDKPQGGERKSDGSVYVPGFGWIEDSGEENKTEDGNFDITGEKIGDM